jgi:OHCU decarboxylase
MARARPFESLEAVQAEAEQVWWDLDQADWLQAFAAHPKIGEKKAAFSSEQSRAWSEQEQSSAAAAPADTVRQLADLNAQYAQRFGYIYIVCATGKSADEMLALLRARLQNDPGTELKIAAGEQAKITRLRLEKLLGAT